jgi:hypothetical protein
MATLTITRGLPGSGKTTWARQQVGAVRVNRDDLRRMLHGRHLGFPRAEAQVTVAQRALVAALLGHGLNVICDDTNLSPSAVRELRRIAAQAGAEVVMRTSPTYHRHMYRPRRRSCRRHAGRRGGDPGHASALSRQGRRASRARELTVRHRVAAGTEKIAAARRMCLAGGDLVPLGGSAGERGLLARGGLCYLHEELDVGTGLLELVQQQVQRRLRVQ